MTNILIILFTTVISIISFPPQIGGLGTIHKPELFDKFKFNPFSTFNDKQYYRIVSHGFIHGSWLHLAFNMITLFFFGGMVEKYLGNIFSNLGGLIFLIFYLSSIIASSIFDLIKQKNNIYYNAIGASGAVSAVLFAAILINPNMKLILFIIPIPISAWIFGVLFLIYSRYMAKKEIDNIGHNAHFTGAVFGVIFMLFVNPELFFSFFKKIFFN